MSAALMLEAMKSTIQCNEHPKEIFYLPFVSEISAVISVLATKKKSERKELAIAAAAEANNHPSL